MQAPITLRRAGVEDARVLWVWRNDPVTRAMSLQTDPVTWDTHREWFARSLQNPARVIWVAEAGGEPVATVRLDDLGSGQAEISINVAPEARGRGIGPAVLRLATDQAISETGYNEVVARIRSANAASVRAFERAGYLLQADGGHVLTMIRRRADGPGGGLRVLVVGCGSIGRRHLRLLRELGVAAEGCETDERQRTAVVRELGVTVHARLDYGLARGFDGAVIATPNHLHVEPALQALAAGCGLLVEKPLSHNLDGVDYLLSGASAARRPLLVGYSLRFHPGLRRVKALLDAGAIGAVRSARVQFGQYLPDWRPWQDYRRSYSALAGMGGGIILDASHELDYTCWLLGEPEGMACLAGRVSDLEIETEDLAEILLRFPGGATASVHLDYLNRTYTRGCELIGDQGTIIWNYPEQTVRLYSPGLGWQEEKIPFVADDMYREELRHFLACLRGEEEPLVSGHEGRRALYLAQMAHRAAVAGTTLNLQAEVRP